VDDSRRPETYLTPHQRRILFVAQVGILSVYLVTNRLLSHLGGGITFDIWLDHHIPLWPIWIVPYLLTLVWWGVALVWAYLKMKDSLYVAFAIGWLSACLIGYTFFVVCPNYMVRPEVTGTTWADWLVQFIYSSDRTYNAFPSQHLWNTVLIALFWSQWQPRWRQLIWVFTVIVALSTVFTRQHWILDVIGGISLGVVGYFAGLAIEARLRPLPRRRPSRASQ